MKIPLSFPGQQCKSSKLNVSRSCCIVIHWGSRLKIELTESEPYYVEAFCVPQLDSVVGIVQFSITPQTISNGNRTCTLQAAVERSASAVRIMFWGLIGGKQFSYQLRHRDFHTHCSSCE